MYEDGSSPGKWAANGNMEKCIISQLFVLVSVQLSHHNQLSSALISDTNLGRQ